MCILPVNGGGSNPPVAENKQLHNLTLLVGGVLVAFGIALISTAQYNPKFFAASMLAGDVAMTLGTPILAFGVILSIYRCANNASQPQSNVQERQRSRSPSSDGLLSRLRRQRSTNSEEARQQHAEAAEARAALAAATLHVNTPTQTSDGEE